MNNHLAQNPFGQVIPPAQVTAFSNSPGAGIGKLIQYGVWLLIITACIYALFNFIIAGYSFMSAGDDSKKISSAWAQIWQTVLGLAVAAGAFVLAAIFGSIIFKDPAFLLNPVIPQL